MKPLVCDTLWTTQQSKAEKRLMWIPFLGWAIAAALERARFRPMVRSIEQQLRERPDTSELWGSALRLRKLSTAIRTLIKEEFGWPNDHFIPNDPFGIAFWGHHDGLDDVNAIMRIEKQFGVRLPDSEWERLWFHGTLGDLADHVIANDRNA